MYDNVARKWMNENLKSLLRQIKDLRNSHFNTALYNLHGLGWQKLIENSTHPVHSGGSLLPSIVDGLILWNSRTPSTFALTLLVRS